MFCGCSLLLVCSLSLVLIMPSSLSVGETKRRGRVRVELRSAVLFRFAESDHRRRVVTPRFAAIEREGGGLVYNPWPQSRYAWQVVVGDSRVKCRCCSRRRRSRQIDCAARPTWTSSPPIESGESIGPIAKIQRAVRARHDVVVTWHVTVQVA